MSYCGFQEFLNALRAFESTLDPEQWQEIQMDFDRPGLCHYHQMHLVDGIAFPMVKAGRLIYQSLSWREYLIALGLAVESQGLSHSKMIELQYSVTNAWGFIGYQVGEAILMETGYYQAAIHPICNLPMYYMWDPHVLWEADQWWQVYTTSWGQSICITRVNTWMGTFNGLDSVYCLADLKRPELQEKVIRRVIRHNWLQLCHLLNGSGMDLSMELQRHWHWQGKCVQASISGFLAASHLVGVHALFDFLSRNSISQDELGTPIWQYLCDFGSYQVVKEDIFAGEST